MLTPIKVSTKTDCVRRINNLLHSQSNTSSESDDQITELTKESFKSSTDYRVVYKNFDYVKGVYVPGLRNLKGRVSNYSLVDGCY